jgi:hypothetical protein
VVVAGDLRIARRIEPVDRVVFEFVQPQDGLDPPERRFRTDIDPLGKGDESNCAPITACARRLPPIGARADENAAAAPICSTDEPDSMPDQPVAEPAGEASEPKSDCRVPSTKPNGSTSIQRSFLMYPNCKHHPREAEHVAWLSTPSKAPASTLIPPNNEHVAFIINQLSVASFAKSTIDKS